MIKLNLQDRDNKQRMNQVDRKKLSSHLLTNLDVTSCIYLLIKGAAKSVYDDPKMTKRNQTCAYPIGTPATNRQQIGVITTRYWMEYHPDDIVIVGGMAVALYDALIQQNTRACGIQSLPYVNNNTSDIDMVWYPRITDTEPDRVYEVLTMRSPAMEEHVMRLEEAIKQAIQDNSIVRDNIVYIIKNKIPHVESVQLMVEKSNTGLLAGAHKILIVCILTYTDHTTITFELCDLSIHDGGSSQITQKEDGSLILVPMYYDPMYCSPFYQLIMIHTPLHVGISVPNIVGMIKQQLLAFQNLLHKSSDKYIIYYKRIRYLQMIITLQNRYPIVKIWGTPTEKVEILHMVIDNMIQSITKEYSNEEELCKIVEQNHSSWQYVPLVELSKKKYTLPSTITYRIRRSDYMTIHLNDELKSFIENTEIGKYYSILSTITYRNEEYKRAYDQLNRIKRLIHDIHDSMYDKVEKRIIAESKLEPLRSLLQKEKTHT